MPLMTEDGKAVDVETANLEFARAMAAPAADEPLTSPPPRKAEAPAEPKRRGRPPASEKARSAKTGATPIADTRSPEKAAEDRSSGVQGLVQIGAGALLVMGQRSNSEPLLCDAVVIAENAAPLGAACAEVAKVNPRFAKALDKILEVGPYGALVTVAFSVGMQVAANHGAVPEGTAGTRTKKEILATLDEVPEAA